LVILLIANPRIKKEAHQLIYNCKKKSKLVLWNIFLDPNSPHVSGNYRQWYKHFDLVLEVVNSMLSSEHNINVKLPRQVTRSPVELLFTCLNVV